MDTTTKTPIKRKDYLERMELLDREIRLASNDRPLRYIHLILKRDELINQAIQNGLED